MRFVAVAVALAMVAVTFYAVPPQPGSLEDHYGSMRESMESHAWLAHAGDPAALVDALERHAPKLPGPGVFQARLQHAAPDGSLRVVATLRDAESIDAHNGAVQLGSGPHAVAWLTPDQLAAWLDDPDVLHIEPDFPLEFASARTALATHAREREFQFSTDFQDEEVGDPPEAHWFTEDSTVSSQGSVIAMVDDGSWKHDGWLHPHDGSRLGWNRFDLCHGGELELDFKWDSFGDSDTGFLLGADPGTGASILAGPWPSQQGFRVVVKETNQDSATAWAGISGSGTYQEVELGTVDTETWYTFSIKDIDCEEASATFVMGSSTEGVDAGGSVAEASWLRVGGGIAVDVQTSPSQTDGATGHSNVIASDGSHVSLSTQAMVAAHGFEAADGVAAVNDVTIGFEAKRGPGSGANPVVKVFYTVSTPGGKSDPIAAGEHVIASEAHATYTTALTEDRTWTPVEAAGLEVIVQHESGTEALIDHIFVHVTYTEAGAPEGPLYVDDIELRNVPSPPAAWSYEEDETGGSLEPTIEGRPAFTGKRATVAIIDGGIDQTHPDFFEWCEPEQLIPDVSVTADAVVPGAMCESRIKAAVTASPLAHATGLAEASSPAPLVNEGSLLPTTESFYSHGTHVAGIVAGNGYLSQQGEPNIEDYGGDGFVFGMAPEAQIVSVSMGNADEGSVPGLNNNDAYEPWYSVAVAALQWTLDHAHELDVRVVLAAWTCKVTPQATNCPEDPPNHPTAYFQVVRALHDAGIMVVVPTGNGADGEGEPVMFSTFALSPYVIGVGSESVRHTTGPHVLEPYNIPGEWGDELGLPENWDPAVEDFASRPDLTAPGGTILDDGIWATRPVFATMGDLRTGFQANAYAQGLDQGRLIEDAYMQNTGSSMAAAHVAGAAAVLFDACPSATALEVMRALKVGAARNMEDWALPGPSGNEPTPAERGYGPLSVRYSLDWLLEAREDCINEDAQNELPALGRLDLHVTYPLRVGQEVHLRLPARDADGIDEWTIDWGDETGSTGQPESESDPTSVSIEALKTYDDAGAYTITVRVSDNDGGVAVAREQVQILPSLDRLNAPFVVTSDEDLDAFCDEDGDDCVLECNNACVLEDVEIPFNPAMHGAAIRIGETTKSVTIRNAVIVLDHSLVEGALPSVEPHEDPEGYAEDAGEWAGVVGEGAGTAAQEAADAVANELGQEEPDPQKVVGAVEAAADSVGDAVDGAPQPASVSDPRNPPRLGSGGPESFGVWISGAENVILENVFVCQRGEDKAPVAAGFFIESSTTTTLEGVGACGNMDGIRLEAATASTISNCFVADNNRGIYVAGAYDGEELEADGNHIHGCLIQDNGVGIELALYEDNERGKVKDTQVAGNRFRSNGLHARDGGEATLWNGEPESVPPEEAVATLMRVPVTGGNWWDDYQGHDASCDAVCPRGAGRPDGLGDTPYYGIEGNQDNHPMVHWAGPVAVLQAVGDDGTVYEIDAYGQDNIVVPPDSRITLQDLSWDPDGDLAPAAWEAIDDELPAELADGQGIIEDLPWGRYTAELTVTDNTGRLAHSRPIHILADHAPEIREMILEATADDGNVGVEVDVFDEDLGVAGRQEELTVEWICGSGDVGTFISGSSPFNGFCQFEKNHWVDHNFKVTVTDKWGAKVEESQAFSVGTSGAPQIDFHWVDEDLRTLTEIRFLDESGYSGNSGVVWQWNFGDGSDEVIISQGDLPSICTPITDGLTCPQRHPVHTYSQGGTYTVELSITWGDFVATAEEDITILNRPPVFDSFVSRVDDGNSPNDVTFEIDAKDLDGMIVEMDLDFGDGTENAIWGGADPWLVSHLYDVVDTYEVVLTAIDDKGDSTTEILDLQIQTTPPEADITWDGDGQQALSTQDCVLFDGSESSDEDADDSVVAWDWDFGDGQTSQEETPEHCYALPGTYTVTLVVEDTHGARSPPVTRIIDILNVAPEPAFTWWPPFPTTVSEVFFTDLSTDFDDGIERWSWDFGDGSTAEVELAECEAVADDPCPERHVTHSYAGQEPGEFEVKLTVTDQSGDVQTLTATLPLFDAAPSVSYEAPQNMATQQPVQFHGIASDPDGDDELLEWSWDFGDGGHSDKPSPSHTYARGGDYRVRLTVTDEDGTQASDAKWVSIANRAPAVSFDIDPAQPMLDEKIAFEPDVTDPEGQDILSWSWDFGDGAASNDVSPEHSYGALGTYTVTLTVVDADGSTTQATHDVQIGNRDPTGAFTANTTTPWTLAPVQFTPSIGDVDGSIVSWDWRFGDGTRSRDRAPVHAYADDGEYTVTLTAIDDADGTTQSSQKIDVRNRAPQPRIDIDPAAPLAGQEVFLAGVAHDLDGRVVEWEWSLDDGDTSTQRTVLHTFPAGTHTITLGATDDDGAEGVATRTLIVGTPAEEATMDYEADGQVVRFQPPASTGSYLWDFGDGNMSSEAGPVHVYEGKGAYVVTVTVTDGDSVQSATSIVHVEGQPSKLPEFPPDESTPAPAFLIILALLVAIRRRRPG